MENSLQVVGVGVVVVVLVAVLVAVAVEEVVVVGKELPPGGKSTRFETVEVLTSEVREHIRPSKLHNHRFFQSSCGLDCSKRDFACNFDSNLVYMLLGDQAPVWVAVAVVAVAVALDHLHPERCKTKECETAADRWDESQVCNWASRQRTCCFSGSRCSHFHSSAVSICNYDSRKQCTFQEEVEMV